jgi:hypothetical protein
MESGGLARHLAAMVLVGLVWGIMLARADAQQTDEIARLRTEGEPAS